MSEATPHEILTTLRATFTTDATGAAFDRVLGDCAERLHAAGAMRVAAGAGDPPGALTEAIIADRDMAQARLANITAMLDEVGPDIPHALNGVMLAIEDRVRLLIEGAGDRPPAPSEACGCPETSAGKTHLWDCPWSPANIRRSVEVIPYESGGGHPPAPSERDMMPRVMALVGGVLMLCDEIERTAPGLPTIDGKRLRVMAEEVRDAWPAVRSTPRAAPPEERK